GALISSSLKISINGNEGADFIVNMLDGSQYGSFLARGGTGDDAIFSFGGRERLFGDDGNDMVFGGAGAQVHGGNGDASIGGGAGSVLFCDAGNDWINMKGTEASISGGAGNDTFRWVADPSTTTDDFLNLPTDFTSGEDTAIAYSSVDGSVLWTL